MAAAEAVALLETLRAQAAEVAAHGREMLRAVRGGRLPTKEGVSLLQVRGHALLSYLLDLALLVCTKSRGGSLGAAGGARERLLETRVVLEKLRPLEQRLKYHLEKLLRAAASGGRGAEDPLSFRPAPSNMAAQEEEEEEDEGRGGGAKAPGLGGGRRYVPPRLVPVSCDAADAEAKERMRRRRRALSSALLRDLGAELGEGPTLEGAEPMGPSAEERRRRHYEESMLQRLSAPYRPKRRRGAGPDLDDITNMGAFPALFETANQDSSEAPRKKKKKPKPGKKKGRKGFRRRR